MTPITNLMGSVTGAGSNQVTPSLSEANTPDLSMRGDLKVMPFAGASTSGIPDDDPSATGRANNDENLGNTNNLDNKESNIDSNNNNNNSDSITNNDNDDNNNDNNREPTSPTAEHSVSRPPSITTTSSGPPTSSPNRRARPSLFNESSDTPTGPTVVDDDPVRSRTSVILGEDDCLHITTNETLEAFPVSSLANSLKGHVLILGNVRPHSLHHLLSPLRAPQLDCGIDQPGYRPIVIMLPTITQLQDKEEVSDMA